MTEMQAGPAGRVLRALLGASSGTPGSDGSAVSAQGEAGAALRAVQQTRPARTVAAKVAAAGGVDRQTALLLRELAGSQLGGDVERWRGLHDALVGHRGSLPQVLAEAPVPEKPPAEGAVVPPAPRSVHATLGLLLEHVEPQHAAVALAGLPEQVATELLAGGTLPAPSLVTAVLDHGDSRVRAALARHPRLDTRVLSRLLTVGDSEVAAAVYRNPRATQSLRRTVAHRLPAEPMDDTLRTELASPRDDVPRTWLAPLLGSGDPQLVASALRSGPRRVAQQYALLRVWERTGPHAVRALLDDPSVARHLSRDVVSEVSAALSDADGGGAGEEPGRDGRTADAVRRLRDRCEPYEDPARLPALLATTRGTSTLRDLLSEPYVHDVDALALAHAKSPFMPKACEELARHEAASDAQRLAFRLSVLNEPWRADGRRAGNTGLPGQRLAEETLDDSAARWAEGMAEAGLLDPVELIRGARPAVHAMAALAALAERALLTDEAVAALRVLADTHLGEDAGIWAALDSLLPEHRGSVAELIADAGRAATATTGEVAAVPGVEEERPSPEARACAPAPSQLSRYDRSLALPALDLLYSLAPVGAPLPDDPDVLRVLAECDWSDAPGLSTPEWFAEACAAHGIAPSGEGSVHVAPTLAEVRAQRPQTYGSSALLTEHAYVQGVLPADELLALLPAGHLLLFPHDWRRLAFAHAWRATLARRLRADLGADPEAWLRLAATASASAASGSTGASEGPTWAELLRLARSGDGPAPHTASHSPAKVPTPRQSGFAATPRPRTPDEAIKLLERGNHLWPWPEGTLLCLADAEVADAVLPRLGPDGPWLLAAYLLRYDRTPRHLLDRLLAGRDPDALRVLAAQCRWLKDGSPARLADLDDPDIDLVLLRHLTHRPTVHRIVTRSRPHRGAEPPSPGARVLAEWRAGGGARPAGGLTWLCSAEPGLVEELLVREGAQLGLGHQLLGCLRLLEHGGADRLAGLAGRNVLGRAATSLCAKALASADPAAVLRARLDRELAPEKLLVKLRRARHAAQARGIVEALPPGEPVDWEALEAAHEQDPLPYWGDLINLPVVPEGVRTRHAALLPEPGPEGLPEGERLTRERARHGLGGQYRCPPATQLDGLLTTGLLTGADLLSLATPAVRMLAYLNAAGRRTDAPPEAAAARAELAVLVRTRLGTDGAAWARVARRLTGGAAEWEHLSTVAALLSR
ncbi:hypothetical protein OG379_13925 [Streptomyces sp. NBC_01166]|uniref:hypothetical protein n=1 Tax=Streptomyces sp. NBC_01166 TaxID=2903755 RepID=UPI003862F18A|nr:hypothetical protein OG379_13925 [Streptomyces sp. NBC_01166]